MSKSDQLWQKVLAVCFAATIIGFAVLAAIAICIEFGTIVLVG